MLKITIIALLLLVSAITISMPWFGAIFYVAISVLSPQNIWYWGMEDIRASLIIASVLSMSFIFHLCMGNISIDSFKTKQNALILLLWITIVLSYYFGAYPPNQESNPNLNSGELLGRYNKIFLMYFLMQPLIQDTKKINILVWALMLVFGFFTYWANSQYLSGEMFSRGIRLAGPVTPLGEGNYTDENVFAMLFVMAIPLFYFLGQASRSVLTKASLFLLIPFAWHSVFLTGSRGGLVGLGVISMHMLFRSGKKILGVIFAVGMVAALAYQGGDIMKQRSDMIVQYQEDASAMSRIEAWKMASSMVTDSPVFGVGLGNFTLAWKQYANTQPRVAHSTVLQFAAENGVLSALAFLSVFLLVASDLNHIKKTAREKLMKTDAQKAGNIIAIGNGLEGSCLGFFVCGLFLNLGIFEIFYIFIMVVSMLKWRIDHIDEEFVGSGRPVQVNADM